MWTHTWMSFTSHTFTSLPLVHTPNLDFWGNVFDLASSWFASLLFIETFTRHNLRIWSSVGFRISQILVQDLLRFTTPGLCRFKIQIFADSRLQGFAGSRFQIFEDSRLRGFAGSRFQIFADSRLRGFAGSRFQIFVDSRLRGFIGSRFKIFAMFNHPENSFREAWQTRHFEGGRFFLNSSTLAPRGSRLTPTIRFHEKTLKFSKKTSPSERQSGHTSFGNLATVWSRRVPETVPPLTPINRELSL
jgi:hypothetical protein